MKRAADGRNAILNSTAPVVPTVTDGTKAGSTDSKADGTETGGADSDPAPERPESTDAKATASIDLTEEHPVLLFDGVCNLCNRWIQFVIEHDPDGIFRFAPLQSEVAGELLDATGYEGADLDSVVLVDDGEYYAKSDAVIRTGKHLGGVYRLLGPTAYVPRMLRDFVYDFVANRRYGWFGKREACMRPTPDVEERFLEFEAGGE